MGVPSGIRRVASYLGRWDLVPDGPPITTSAAKLLPVLRNGEPAMLKLSHEGDERLGGVMMEWWGGDGAARVLARNDDEACQILCLLN